MFSEYILGQYLTLIADVISWVDEEHEIVSDKGFFKQFMSEKCQGLTISGESDNL